MKKLLLALCLATVQTVSAQTADQHIGTLINESNWFELKRTMDDTLRIGPMAWQNVPFLIVDTRTGDAETDSIGDLLQPVIGLPIILSMKEVQFDFIRRELLIPATPTPNPMASSNLLRTDSEGLRVESRDDEGRPIYMHLDTGSYGSDLTARWYAAHRTQVEAQGQPDSLRMAGIGGVSKQQTFRMPRITYRIGQGQAALDDVHVSTGLDLRTGQSVGNLFGISDIDGIIGLGLLERFRRVTLNLEEMYINAE